MHTTIELIEAAKEKLGFASDGQLARRLDLSRSAISCYRNKSVTLDDSTAEKIAEILEMPPEYVVACMHAERARGTPQRALWERMAKRMATAAAVAIFASLLTHPTNGYTKSPERPLPHSVYYVKSLGYLILRILRSIFPQPRRYFPA